MSSLKEQMAELDQQEKDLKAKRHDLYRQSIATVEEEDKLCPDHIAEMLSEPSPFHRPIEYPIEVSAINLREVEILRPSPVKWVSVRPCGDKYEDKTYLGIMLGDLALGTSASYSKEGVLHVGATFHNPAMYVPELHEVIYGCGSWWGEVNTPEDLKKISDQDISNIWYVRAMKEMHGINPDSEEEENA